MGAEFRALVENRSHFKEAKALFSAKAYAAAEAATHNRIIPGW